MQKIFSIGLVFFLAVVFSINAEEVIPVKIENVEISAPIINPSKGEKCAISYNLVQSSSVTIKIYDENEQLVRTLINDKKRKAGINEEKWDGKDDKGIILPPEAYTFTIEGQGFMYNPASFSGGELLKNLNATVRKEPPCSFSYTLPTSARVRIRIGVKAGPLYRTLIDWQPRPSGEHTESWDGKDKTGKVNLASNPSSFVSVEAFGLPENSIILAGTPQQQKKLETKPTKQETETSSRQLYEHALHPRYRCKDPEVKIILPTGISFTKDGLPIISGKCALTIKIDQEDLKWLKEENPEYLFYIDDKFLSEEEQISSPYIWQWDSSKYKEGKYLLAVNLRTFSDHCATDCIWVYVKNKN
jgi:flagellar hook assembly protein FlgD